MVIFFSQMSFFLSYNFYSATLLLGTVARKYGSNFQVDILHSIMLSPLLFTILEPFLLDLRTNGMRASPRRPCLPGPLEPRQHRMRTVLPPQLLLLHGRQLLVANAQLLLVRFRSLELSPSCAAQASPPGGDQPISGDTHYPAKLLYSATRFY